MIISGAFGLFELETVIEVGGLDVDSIAEDFELSLGSTTVFAVGRGHYRIVSVPEPVAWTEVPAPSGAGIPAPALGLAVWPRRSSSTDE